MKLESKIEARKLRKEQGLSVKKIAALLKVGVGSVSVWTRDIELNESQKETLRQQNPIFNRQIKANRTKSLKCKKQREQYQQEGRNKAKENNPLHMQACMLYWAEGAKSRNAAKFANSDPEMIVLFSKFLQDIMKVPIDKITLHTHVYLNNNLTLEDIETYWLNKTNLPKSCLRKSSINIQPISSQGLKKNKLIYGVCYLAVNSTEIIQHIYGAIQEYSGTDNPTWIDLPY